MSKPVPNLEEKVRMYFEEKKSLSEIALVFDTNPKQIGRELKRAGYTLRSRSDAQRQRLNSGKAEHPTKGKNLSESTKRRISDSLHESWEGLSEEERNRRKDVAREIFNNRPDKDEVIQAGFKAINKAAKEGSIFEKYLADLLNEKGYYVLIHQKHDIEDSKMHLDILLPKESIAIEVDGPSHYADVWGKESLEKSQERDAKKNGLLIAGGYSVIRVKQPSSISQFFLRDAGQRVLEALEKINSNKSPEIISI